jgi:hypothetical protein
VHGGTGIRLGCNGNAYPVQALLSRRTGIAAGPAVVPVGTGIDTGQEAAQGQAGIAGAEVGGPYRALPVTADLVCRARIATGPAVVPVYAGVDTGQGPATGQAVFAARLLLDERRGLYGCYLLWLIAVLIEPDIIADPIYRITGAFRACGKTVSSPRCYRIGLQHALARRLARHSLGRGFGKGCGGDNDVVRVDRHLGIQGCCESPADAYEHQQDKGKEKAGYFSSARKGTGTFHQATLPQ